MDTIQSNEIFGHFNLTINEDADKEQVETEATRILEGIKTEMLGENNTPAILNEYRQKIGERLTTIAGVTQVQTTALLSGNPPTIRMTLKADLRTGALTVVAEEVIEGKPVPTPPWADRR